MHRLPEDKCWDDTDDEADAPNWPFEDVDMPKDKAERVKMRADALEALKAYYAEDEGDCDFDYTLDPALENFPPHDAILNEETGAVFCDADYEAMIAESEKNEAAYNVAYTKYMEDLKAERAKGDDGDVTQFTEPTRPDESPAETRLRIERIKASIVYWERACELPLGCRDPETGMPLDLDDRKFRHWEADSDDEDDDEEDYDERDVDDVNWKAYEKQSDEEAIHMRALFGILREWYKLNDNNDDDTNAQDSNYDTTEVTYGKITLPAGAFTGDEDPEPYSLAHAKWWPYKLGPQEDAPHYVEDSPEELLGTGDEYDPETWDTDDAEWKVRPDQSDEEAANMRACFEALREWYKEDTKDLEDSDDDDESNASDSEGRDLNEYDEDDDFMKADDEESSDGDPGMSHAALHMKQKQADAEQAARSLRKRRNFLADEEDDEDAQEKKKVKGTKRGRQTKLINGAADEYVLNHVPKMSEDEMLLEYTKFRAIDMCSARNANGDTQTDFNVALSGSSPNSALSQESCKMLKAKADVSRIVITTIESLHTRIMKYCPKTPIKRLLNILRAAVDVDHIEFGEIYGTDDAKCAITGAPLAEQKSATLKVDVNTEIARSIFHAKPTDWVCHPPKSEKRKQTRDLRAQLYASKNAAAGQSAKVQTRAFVFEKDFSTFLRAYAILCRFEEYCSFMLRKWVNDTNEGPKTSAADVCARFEKDPKIATDVHKMYKWAMDVVNKQQFSN